MQTSLTLCEIGDPGLPDHESFSPFCLKVHRALRAAGLRYERRHGRPDSFREHNPLAQVPVLLLNDEAVADSTAILARIVELVPGALERSAEALLWEELADTSVNAYLVAARWADDDNWTRTRPAYFTGMPKLLGAIIPRRLRAGMIARLRAREVWRGGAAECWRRFDTLLDALEGRAPTAGFWLGTRLSVADVALFGQLWSFFTALTPKQAEMVRRREKLTAYLERVDGATRAAPTQRGLRAA